MSGRSVFNALVDAFRDGKIREEDNGSHPPTVVDEGPTFHRLSQDDMATVLKKCPDSPGKIILLRHISQGHRIDFMESDDEKIKIFISKPEHDQSSQIGEEQGFDDLGLDDTDPQADAKRKEPALLMPLYVGTACGAVLGTIIGAGESQTVQTGLMLLGAFLGEKAAKYASNKTDGELFGPLNHVAEKYYKDNERSI